MENATFQQTSETNETEEEELISLFHSISDKDIKESIIALIKSLNTK